MGVKINNKTCEKLKFPVAMDHGVDEALVEIENEYEKLTGHEYCARVDPNDLTKALVNVKSQMNYLYSTFEIIKQSYCWGCGWNGDVVIICPECGESTHERTQTTIELMDDSRDC